MYWATLPTVVCVVCVVVSVHLARGRLARQETSLPKPRARAGAQVGTVRAIRLPFLTGIVWVRANWAVIPKYAWSGTTGLWASRRKWRFAPPRRTAIPAEADPPSLASKKAICFLFG